MKYRSQFLGLFFPFNLSLSQMFLNTVITLTVVMLWHMQHFQIDSARITTRMISNLNCDGKIIGEISLKFAIIVGHRGWPPSLFFKANTKIIEIDQRSLAVLIAFILSEVSNTSMKGSHQFRSYWFHYNILESLQWHVMYSLNNVVKWI